MLLVSAQKKIGSVTDLPLEENTRERSDFQNDDGVLTAAQVVGGSSEKDRLSH